MIVISEGSYKCLHIIDMPNFQDEVYPAFFLTGSVRSDTECDILVCVCVHVCVVCAVFTYVHAEIYYQIVTTILNIHIIDNYI